MTATFPRCKGCHSRLNVWTIPLCHNCTKPTVPQPKIRLHLVKSDEADRDAVTPQPASDHTDLTTQKGRADMESSPRTNL